MKLEVMRRGVAAMLCCAVLTAGMPVGALAEGEVDGAELTQTLEVQMPETQTEAS